MPDVPLIKQVELVIGTLKDRRYDVNDTVGAEAYRRTIDWLRKFPHEVDPSLRETLIETACLSFSLRRADIMSAVVGEKTPSCSGDRKDTDSRLRKILPGGSWFEWYDIYTRQTESPLSYHIFSSLCVLGAAVGRKVVLDRGFFQIVPTIGLVLVGRSGIKKTSAVDISMRFVRDGTLCPILSESITRSRMITVLARDGGHQFFYVPEFASLMSKTSYLEGMVVALLRLMDSPKHYDPMDTQIRGKEEVEDVAITLLGATTPDQIGETTPKEVVNSGFVNRFLWIVENYSERCFPTPSLDESVLIKLSDTVRRVSAFTGDASFSPRANEMYEEWYRGRKKRMDMMEDEGIVDSIQRGSTHMLKIAILTSIACHDTVVIPEEAMHTAINLVEFSEESIPQLLRQVKMPMAGEADMVVRTIAKLGGACDHSTLLRRLSWKFKSGTLKAKVEDLKEQGIIVVKRVGVVTYYKLRGEVEDDTEGVS